MHTFKSWGLTANELDRSVIPQVAAKLADVNRRDDPKVDVGGRYPLNVIIQDWPRQMRIEALPSLGNDVADPTEFCRRFWIITEVLVDNLREVVVLLIGRQDRQIPGADGCAEDPLVSVDRVSDFFYNRLS